MGRNSRHRDTMAPTFLERMQNDQFKRQETGFINELKKEAKDAGKKFKDPRGKNFGKKVVEEPPNGTGLGVAPPKTVTHGRNKYREKNKHLDQWGPLGW